MSTDYYILPFFLAGSLILALFAFFLVFYVVIQKNKQNRFALEKQKLKLEVNENTMNQISQEIHDNVGQILFLAEINTSSLFKMLSDEKARELVNETGELVRQAISDLRNISHSLNSEQIKQLGLAEALKQSIHHIHQAKVIDCTITITGKQVRLFQEKELMIFRIAQEAISNTLKHSKATKLELILDYTKEKVCLTICDNGVGFDKMNHQNKPGVGLINMSQRTKVLDGTLSIESSVGKGCTLILTVDI